MIDKTIVPRGTFLDKPYVTARQAAEAFGVPLETVLLDVVRGQGGAIDALIGGTVGDYVLLHSWQITQPYLDMHRARLSDIKSEAP